MTVFVHSKQGVETIELPAGQTAGELLAGHDDAELWLENADAPLLRDTAIADLPPGAHLSRSTCKRVAAKIHFNDDEKTESFPSGTTVERVFQWAVGKDGFDLPTAQRPKHTLALCGTTTQPEKSTHLSELADDTCAVCFDLAPKERFAG
jgi:hypothetical protein